MSSAKNSHATPARSHSSATSAVAPIVLVIIGVLILMGQNDIMPRLTTLWTIGLAAGGILSFVLNGFNKSTVVVGSFLILASLLSILRTKELLSVEQEFPIIFIALGTLMLVARSAAIPESPARTAND